MGCGSSVPVTNTEAAQPASAAVTSAQAAASSVQAAASAVQAAASAVQAAASAASAAASAAVDPVSRPASVLTGKPTKDFDAQKFAHVFGSNLIAAHPAVTLLRNTVLQNSEQGIRGLAKSFEHLRASGNDKALNQEEVQNYLQQFKITVTQQDLNEIFQFFDRSHDGKINFEEFVQGIRGEMIPTRSQLVFAAWNQLSNTETVTVAHFKASFGGADVDKLVASIQLGEASESISKKQFLEYYRDVSCSIDGQAEFASLLQNSWKLEQAAVKAILEDDFEI